jgi:general secretion pathway protein I
MNFGTSFFSRGGAEGAELRTSEPGSRSGMGSELNDSDSGPSAPPREPIQASNAFTLLEVLVGIAILAMAAVVLGAAYVNTMSAHATVARRAVDGPGMEYLREAILNEPDRAKVEQGGSVPLPDGRQLQWTATLEELPVPDLFRVEVRGRIDGGKEPEEFTQVVNLLRPTWSDPTRREQIRIQWNERREEAERQ